MQKTIFVKKSVKVLFGVKMSYENNIKPEIKKETSIEFPAKNGCTVSSTGCLSLFIFICLACIAYNGKKWSDIKVQQEQIKLQQMQDGTLINNTPFVAPDTLRIGKYQKTYMPMSKMIQKQR